MNANAFCRWRYMHETYADRVVIFLSEGLRDGNHHNLDSLKDYIDKNTTNVQVNGDYKFTSCMI